MRLALIIAILLFITISECTKGVTKQTLWVKNGARAPFEGVMFKPFEIEELNNLKNFLQYDYIEVFLSPLPQGVELNDVERIPSVFRNHYSLHSLVHGRPFREINGEIPSGYHDPSQLMASFQAIQSSYPSIAKIIDITAQYSLPNTIDGNSIYALKLSDNVEDDEDEENVLIVSNHHARELLTPEIALDTAQTLSSSYATNATIAGFINKYQIYIVWTMNPDGLAYVWSVDNMWRKNRRDNGDGSHGVDLNRNYDFGWSFSCGGSTVRYGETYRGPYPNSEIEVQTMLTFQFDRSFSKVLDFHSYAMEVRPNYAACATLPASIDTLFKQYGDALVSTAHRYERGVSCCTGGDISNAYYSLGALSNLIETGTAFQPSTEVMKVEVPEVWPMTFTFLQFPTPLLGHVYDLDTNLPIPDALISIPEIEWYYDEVWRSSKKGRYALWLPVGFYNIEIHKYGYINQTLSANITSLSTTVELDFYLSLY